MNQHVPLACLIAACVIMGCDAETKDDSSPIAGSQAGEKAPGGGNMGPSGPMAGTAGATPNTAGTMVTAGEIMAPIAGEFAGAVSGGIPGGMSVGGSVPSGGAACLPTTCSENDAECGSLDDGCGQALDCGSCSAPANAMRRTDAFCPTVHRHK